MRVYLKGVASGLVLLLCLVLLVRHWRRSPGQSDLDDDTHHRGGRSRDKDMVNSGGRSGSRGPAARGRQGAATAAARIQAAERVPKKTANSRQRGGGGGGASGGGRSSSPLTLSRPQSPLYHTPLNPKTAVNSQAFLNKQPPRVLQVPTKPPEEKENFPDPVAVKRPEDGGRVSELAPPPGPTARLAPPLPAISVQSQHAPTAQAVEKLSTPEEQAPGNAGTMMDIRTVDPLSATEPMVIRQQEELQQQQRFGFQPWRGRPKPPEKVQDESQTWLKDLEYPDWYLESEKRSKVYGRKDFVGGEPLYEGPCPGAEQVKARYLAEKVKTFSYVEPGQFLPTSKNPCWYEDPKRKRQMRCLPYFYVAGVAKGGTTDLYKRVRYHPDIMEGELKEYHWWDRLRYGATMELKFTKNSEKNDSPLPLAEYSRIITGDEMDLLKADLRSRNHSDRICGDGSPSYLWDATQWTIFVGNEGCTEPRIVSGSFIQHANPESKILLLFRHPTQRLYSRFLSRIPRTPAFKGATPQMFHNYVVKGVECYKKCFREHSIRECAYNETLYDEAVIRMIEGLYSVFLEDWLRIFRRDQIMMIRSEDYSEDIEGYILKVFNFLGVATLEKNAMRPVLTHVSTNIGQNYGKVGPMLPETIQLLNGFYKPFVLRLHQLTGEEKFLWKDIAVT